MLYFRQILILLVSLYTVRIVLNILGIEDYGIYTVVGGIVAFFSFLSGTMASATQRFFSFALGQNDSERLKKTFTVNWLIYGGIAIVALILLETVGLWFVNEQLKVPPERFESVRWIYHFSILTFIATILTTPFMSIIIAHEDMQIYAYVSIIEAIMKLSAVFLLKSVTWDKLELYGMLLFAVSIINAIIYIAICTGKYTECQFRHFYWDKGLLHEIMGFTGWTLFGQITSVARNQAVTIMLNQVFNPVIVAARAIAVNITGHINMFSNNFNVGLSPPIIKLYAANNKKEMFLLIYNGSKITFFLMWVFALPLFLEMDIILKIWLKNPPFEAVLFTRLALVEVLINSISLPIGTTARAPGKMKVYELTLGSIQIVIFIVSWFVLAMGGLAYSVFVIAIIANLVMFAVRLLIVRKLITLSLNSFFRQVLFPISMVILFSVTPSLMVYLFLPKTIVFTIILVLLSIIITCASMYFLGFNKQEQEKIRHIIKSKIYKYFRCY
ncbi:MAG: polysaccharide biosynthesis protein [Bacteroidales bacterium]|nr:polysaccharide biosynthesis protein [Bacteroidales bacterium]